MFTEKRYLVVFSLLVLALVVVGGIAVTSVQGQGNTQIGVVNMEAVFTEHMAPPLFAARDQMQQEFESKAAELTDEEKEELFSSYQTQLDQIEQEYVVEIEMAVEEVAQANGVELVIDSSAVLVGGMDLTDAVVESLK